MIIHIEEGSPKDDSSRKESEQAVYRFLNQQKIPFTRMDHEALVSMDGYEAIQDKAQAIIPKNLFLCNRQQTEFYLLLMPGNKKFQTRLLSSQIHSARLSFGNEESLAKYLNCYHGSTSVFGLLYDSENQVRLLIDQDLLKSERIGFHPCVNTSTVVLKTSDLLESVLPSLHHSPFVVSLSEEEIQ